MFSLFTAVFAKSSRMNHHAQLCLSGILQPVQSESYAKAGHLPDWFYKQVCSYAENADSAWREQAIQELVQCRWAGRSGCWPGCPQRYIIAGDEIAPYLVIMNSHDGGSGVKVAMTPIRVVCQNTLTISSTILLPGPRLPLCIC